MPVSYFVLYRGEADDGAAFVARYRDVHVPILKTWPGVREVIVHTAMPWIDPHSIEASGLLMMAQMLFDSRDDLERALRSPGRTEARADFHLFPPFRGAVLHQAVVSEVI